MEVKKSATADLQNKRTIFLQIGLIVALVLSITAFRVSQSEKVIRTIDLGRAQIEADLPDITVQQDKPTEPARIVQIHFPSDILEIHKKEIETTKPVSWGEFIENAPAPVALRAVNGNREEIIEEDIFMLAETMPVFGKNGGKEEFRRWVLQHLTYPVVAVENQIQGKVTLEFIVEKDGTIGRIRVLSSPDQVLSDEAIRIVGNSPKWSPGKQRNNPVAVRFTLPVDFVLQ